MTWHTFFKLPFGSYPHNLFIGYVGVWVLQAGYLAWVAVNWVRTGRGLR